MSRTIWAFMKPNDGRPVERLTLKHYTALYDRLEPVPARFVHEDGYAYFAEVVVELDARVVVSFGRARPTKTKVMEDGLLDEDHMQDHLVSAMSSYDYGTPTGPDRPVHSEHRFYARRLEALHRWKLTEADEEAVTAELLKRAPR